MIQIPVSELLLRRRSLPLLLRRGGGRDGATDSSADACVGKTLHGACDSRRSREQGVRKQREREIAHGCYLPFTLAACFAHGHSVPVATKFCACRYGTVCPSLSASNRLRVWPCTIVVWSSLSAVAWLGRSCGVGRGHARQRRRATEAPRTAVAAKGTPRHTHTHPQTHTYT